MKNLYITLSFVIASSTLSAQNKDTKNADRLFNRFEYVDAASEYLKLVDKGKADGYVYKQLADSYYNVFNAAEASKWYAKALTEKQDAETYYRYAQMLKADGKYEEANKQLQKFANMAPNDQRAIAFKQNPNYLPKLNEKAKSFDIKSLDINSDKSDFGAMLSNDNTLYFASARNTSRKTYGWNEQPYLDLYSAVYNADGTFSQPTAVEGVNTKFHDGPASISADGNTMYLASESFNEGLFEKDKAQKLKFGQVALFKSVKADGKWSKPTPLPFNSKDYSTSNPSLSKDGKTLYFSSNMPGSVGGVDIWKVSVNADGSFGTPENLGKKINTEGNESFPFITDENKLYFSSDARQGFGGMDVYVIDLNKGTEAANVGKPVNSEKDDFAFSFNTAKNIGFVSSNRGGVDNIYSATPVCGVEVVSLVRDAKTGSKLSGARVAILDEKNNIIATKTTAADGTVSYDVECDKAYTLQVAKDGYESNNFPVSKTRGGIVNINADLQPIDVIVTETEIILNDIYFEYDKSNITPKFCITGRP